METPKSILFPWEKSHVSDTNPLALHLKLLRAQMESVLNAPSKEKIVMHALQVF